MFYILEGFPHTDGHPNLGFNKSAYLYGPMQCAAIHTSYSNSTFVNTTKNLASQHVILSDTQLCPHLIAMIIWTLK